MPKDIGTLQEKGAAREAVAKGILGERITDPSGPDERAIHVLQKAHDKDSPLTELITSPVSTASIEEAKDKSIGWSWEPTRDVDGKVTITKNKIRTKESQDNLDDAEDYIEFVQDFLQKGYSKLPGVPNTLDRDAYREKALGIIVKIWPEAAGALSAMSSTEQKMAMDNILKTTLFAEKMKEAMEEAVKFGKEPKVMDPELKRRKTEAELELQRLLDRKKTLEIRSSSVGEIYKPFSIKDRLVDGADLDELAREIIGNIKTTQGELDDLEGAESSKQRMLNGVKGNDSAASDQRSTIITSIDGIQKDIRNKKNELRGHKDMLADLERYRESSSKTGKTEHESQDKIDELDHQIRIAQTRLLDIQADYNLAEDAVKGHEAAFVSKLKGVPEKALRAYLDEMTGRFEEIRDAQIKKNGDSQLLIGLQDRWNFKGIGGKRAGELNKIAIRQDYKDLITNGPDDVVIRTLMAGGMSYEEAEAKMDSDDAFVKRARQDVVERLLSRRLQSGGGITTPELERIVENKEWGGPELIRRAIDSRTNALGTSELESLKAAGFHSDGLAEKLKQLPKNRLVQLLLLILLLGVTLSTLGGFGLLTAAAGKVGGVAAGAYHGVTGAIGGAYHGVTGAVGGAYHGVTGGIGGGIESVHDAVTGSADAARDAVSSGSPGGFDNAIEGGDAVGSGSVATGVGGQAIPPGPLYEGASNVSSAIGGAASTVIEDTGSVIDHATPVIVDGVSSTSSAIGGAVSATIEGANSAGSVVGHTTPTVVEGISSAGSAIGGAAPAVAADISKGVTEYGPTMVDKAANISAGDLARIGAVGIGAPIIVRQATKGNSKGGH